jgi:hypothetical protein
MNFSQLQGLSKFTGAEKLQEKQVDTFGIQYNLVRAENEARYRVLDGTALVKEREEIEAARAMLMSMRKEKEKEKSSHAANSTRTDKGGAKKQQEAAQFKEALLTRQIGVVNGSDAQDVVGKILETGEEENETDRNNRRGMGASAPSIDYARNATHPGSWSHIQPSGFGVQQSGAERVQYSMSFIRDKFHDNVDIIESLYREREALRERVDVLEKDLVDPERAAWIVRASKYGLPVSAAARSSGNWDAAETAGNAIPLSSRSSGSATGTRSGAGRNLKKMQSTRPASARAHTSASESKLKSGAGAHVKKQPTVLSPEDMARLLQDEKENSANSRRGQAGQNKGCSKRLMADMDRYVQRRREHDLHEETKRLAREKEEQEYEERKRRALKHPATGTSIDGLESRAKEYQKRKDEHMEKLRKEQLAQERAPREQFSHELREHIRRGVVEQDMTYDAQLELEALRRKERIERRKNELLLTSKAPIDYDPSKRRFDDGPRVVKPFVARNPQEVMENLEMQALKWQTHLEDVQAQQRRSEQENRIYLGLNAAAKDPTMGMAARQNASRERREARLKREEQAKQDKLARQIAREKRDVMHLANATAPVSGRRLTQAAEKRAILVRQKIEAEKAREAEHKRKSAMAGKENKNMLSDLRQSISAQESRRKAQHGNFTDIGSQDKAIAKAQQSAQEARDRAKANQLRIQQSLQGRVSLYDRQKLEQEKQKAADRAIGILKTAIVGDVGEAKSRSKQGGTGGAARNAYDSEAKGRSRGASGTDGDRDGDGEIDFKMLHSDPVALSREVVRELLDGKEQLRLGMRDADMEAKCL